jgi:hypothetical protein
MRGLLDHRLTGGTLFHMRLLLALLVVTNGLALAATPSVTAKRT